MLWALDGVLLMREWWVAHGLRCSCCTYNVKEVFDNCKEL